jgi:peptidyl-prolyl cis-trans isomerase A (cyclophilin A)
MRSYAMVPMTLLILTACGGEPRGKDASATRDSAVAAVAREIPGPAATPMRSPDTFRVLFGTSKGEFTVEVKRALAPLGADRFYELVTIGYFDDVRFFRMKPGFIAQFGINGDPKVYAKWEKATIPDEPMRTGNSRGTITFATNGTDGRTVQMFISTGDNRKLLDQQRVFAPIGSVVEGMDVVDKLNTEYGEEPNNSRIAGQGNVYLQKWFPALDYITSAKVLASQP